MMSTQQKRDSNPAGSAFMVITAILALASIAVRWWVFVRSGVGDSTIRVDVYAMGTVVKQWCDPSCSPDTR
jgi:hypothetical protein